jgi:hypothetical protein
MNVKMDVMNSFFFFELTKDDNLLTPLMTNKHFHTSALNALISLPQEPVTVKRHMYNHNHRDTFHEHS